MKQLTKGEEQIMHVLWSLERAFVKDIIAELPDPKPAYNTVSTIVRILERKGFVGYRAYGKTHEYYPLVDKPEYTQAYLRHFVKNYFSNSYRQMVSFFTREEDLSIAEMEEMQNLIREEIAKQKNNDK
jgi:BlaI family transcriptional regulator, penicillinase repressor